MHALPSIMVITSHDQGAGNDQEACGLGPEFRLKYVFNVDNMGVMICLGLHFLSLVVRVYYLHVITLLSPARFFRAA